MKAVVVAFNQKKALVGAFSVITNLIHVDHHTQPSLRWSGWGHPTQTSLQSSHPGTAPHIRSHSAVCSYHTAVMLHTLQRSSHSAVMSHSATTWSLVMLWSHPSVHKWDPRQGDNYIETNQRQWRREKCHTFTFDHHTPSLTLSDINVIILYHRYQSCVVRI